MTEPTYEYVKGQGWVAFADGFKTKTFFREHKGKTYRVTLRKPEEGDLVKRGEYVRDREWPNIEEIEWWPEWEGIPEGFGGGMNYTYHEGGTWRVVEIITELV